MLTILNYNENKVKEGIALRLDQNQFGRPVNELSFYEKLRGFEAFMNENRRATTKAVHISLNFHPDEKLNGETLKAIAGEYMDRMGFGEQPYLVYQHLDAGHPHLHIVTTNIRKDGSRITLYRIGKYESEKARKAIENKYGLIKAKGRKQEAPEVNPVGDVRKVSYGKSEIKRNVSNVVRSVIRHYKYTSLPELNAVLSQFNVIADRGSESSRMHKAGGLYYRVLDEQGKKIGMPIKASLIFGKPTLKYLEKQFKLNDKLRAQHKASLIQRIDQSFGQKSSITKNAFIQALNQRGIYVLLRQNAEGRIYGVTFVDHKNNVVFNGSDLGKSYSANAVTSRLTGLSRPGPQTIQSTIPAAQPKGEDKKESSLEPAMNDLITARQYDYTSPDAAIRRRKRKKRRGRSI